MAAPSRTTQAEKGRRFHALHAGPEVLVLPNAWDAGSALMMVQAGYPALASTSSGVAFAQGYRDGERMPRERMLDVVHHIAEAVDVPVSADLETGYGATPAEVAETIRLAIAAGAVGVNLEDSPTRGGDPLIAADAMCERLRAAREAADAGDVPFVINARTDPFLRRPKTDAAENFAESVRRAHAYIEAGADSIFVPGVRDPDTIARLAREISAPLNVLASYAGQAVPPVPELKRLGVRRVSLGGSLANAALAMVRRALEDLRDGGTFGYVVTSPNNAEMNRLLER